MRRTTAGVFALILMGTLIGCGGKGSPTPAPVAPTPTTEPLPKRETPRDSPATGTTPAPGTALSGSKGNLKVEIANATLSINGTTVAMPAEMAIFEKLLGKPSWTSEKGINRWVEWKELGIRGLQETDGSQKFITITFNFDPFWDESTKTFSKPFAGEIVLEGQPIKKSTDPEELSKKITSLKKTMLMAWRIPYENKMSVYVDIGYKSTSAVRVEKLE